MTKYEIIDIFDSSPKIDRFVFWDKKTEDDDFDPSIASFDRSFLFNELDHEFENDVIEFLAQISLTYTIYDIDVYSNNFTLTNEMHITLSYDTTNTNIDCEVLDSVLNNIKD